MTGNEDVTAAVRDSVTITDGHGYRSFNFYNRRMSIDDDAGIDVVMRVLNRTHDLPLTEADRDLVVDTIVDMTVDDIVTDALMSDDDDGDFTPEEILEVNESFSWVVEGLLARGSVTLFASDPKCGKSTILRNLARAVSVGEPFLDMDTSESRVLYVTNDEKTGSIARHVGRMRGGWGDVTFRTRTRPTLAMNLARTRSWIGDEGPRSLVVVDTLARFLQNNEAKSTDDYSLNVRSIGAIGDLADETGCAFVLVHHHNKSQTSVTGHRILGSQGIFGAVDDVLHLTRDASSDVRRMFAETGRYVTMTNELFLAYDEATHRVTRLDEERVDEARRERTERRREDRYDRSQDEMRERIARTVTEHRVTSMNDAYRRVLGDRNVFSRVFREMREAGEIVKFNGRFHRGEGNTL